MSAIPAIRTTAVLTPSLRVATRPRARARSQSNFLVVGIVFCGLSYAFYGISSLAGSVLAEKARRETIAAVGRTKSATVAVDSLRRQVDQLRSLDAIDRWAAQNGFVAADRNLRTSLDVRNGTVEP